MIGFGYSANFISWSSRLSTASMGKNYAMYITRKIRRQKMAETRMLHALHRYRLRMRSRVAHVTASGNPTQRRVACNMDCDIDSGRFEDAAGKTKGPNITYDIVLYACGWLEYMDVNAVAE